MGLEVFSAAPTASLERGDTSGVKVVIFKVSKNVRGGGVKHLFIRCL